MLFIVIFLGRTVSFLIRLLHIGAGGTWPGEVALRLNPYILSELIGGLKKGVILIAGTNGKTTTGLMIKTMLENNSASVVSNVSGANLENGIVSALIDNPHADYGVFEVDENSLPLVVSSIKYQVSSQKEIVIVLLNLFRDQLDRYGEVDIIAEKWQKALELLDRSETRSRDTFLVLNADDPLVAHLGLHARLPVTFFGVNDKTKYLSKMEHATDSTFCLSCGNRLQYDGVYFSHLGLWRCPVCKEKRPHLDVSVATSPLPGLYNQYNALAATSVAKVLNIKPGFKNFQPSFGRQEEMVIDGKKVMIFLSKNPAGFNQSLRTVLELGAKQLLLVLNDRIPDGRDVSWIWDVDFEMLPFHITSVVSGDRAYDLALRLKYAKPYHKLPKGAVSEPQTPILVYPNLRIALKFCVDNPNKSEPLYILATYSAMLEVRKILRGRKIL